MGLYADHDENPCLSGCRLACNPPWAMGLGALHSRSALGILGLHLELLRKAFDGGPQRAMNSLYLPVPHLLAVAEGGEEAHHGLGFLIFFYVFLTLAVMFGFFALARKGLNPRVSGNMPTRIGEHIYLFLEKVCVGIIGPRGKEYMPFLATLWFFIITSNLIGMFFGAAVTANLGINLGMSIVTVAYVQYCGVKSNGLGGHLKHFAGPVGIPIFISILLFVVELVSEAAKIGSLALRLFANIEGGHMVVENLNNVAGHWPVGGVLIPIKLLTAILQAFIWIVLTAVYISLVTHGDHDEHEEHPDHGGTQHMVSGEAH